MDERKPAGPAAGAIQVLVLADEGSLRAAIDELFAEGMVAAAVGWRRAPAVPEAARDAGTRRYVRRLPVRKPADVIRYLDVEQIDWIEAASQYARLHVGKEGHLIRESMARLASWLDPERFLRIHRSVIVNLDRVLEIRVDSPSRRWAVLRNGRSLPVSPASWETLQTALLGFQ